jgi:TolB protein
MTRLLRRLALVLLVLPLATFAQEPPQIDVIGGQAAALPIAVVPFAGSPGDTDIGKVIAADLDRSGQFRTLPSATWSSAPRAARKSATPPGAR